MAEEPAIKSIGRDPRTLADLSPDQVEFVKKITDKIKEFSGDEIMVNFLPEITERRGGKELQAKIAINFKITDQELAASCYSFFAFYHMNLRNIERGDFSNLS